MMEQGLGMYLHSNACSRRGIQRGASLIEALVALVVLALGVMGLAGVQTRALLEARTTNSRTVAVQLSQDLAERVQFTLAMARDTPINPAAQVAAVLAAYGSLPDWGSAAPADPGCVAGGVTCTAAQMANSHLARWRAQVAATLPNGQAVITRVGDQLAVGIAWRENVTEKAEQAAGANAFVVTVPGVPDCPAGSICHLMWIPRL